MIKIKKLVSVTAALLMFGVFSTSVMAASNYNSPAEVVAGVTDKTVQEVVKIKEDSNKTYGEIAKDEGNLEEFKTEMLEVKKDAIAKKVSDGKITQERADEIIKRITENNATCDGTGTKKLGRNNGLAFGKGKGEGKGKRNGDGMKRDNGQRGQRMRNGTCIAE